MAVHTKHLNHLSSSCVLQELPDKKNSFVIERCSNVECRLLKELCLTCFIFM
jgi:hypothetical protein